MNQFTKLIAAQLNLKEQAVENTLALLEEGCTIPFISRYRKEKTGNMDEVNIEAIAQANEKLSEMAKRKETILKTIEEQGKLSDELKKRITDMGDFLQKQPTAITEYDEPLVRRLIEKVTVYEDKFTVEFKSGVTVDVNV